MARIVRRSSTSTFPSITASIGAIACAVCALVTMPSAALADDTQSTSVPTTWGGVQGTHSDATSTSLDAPVTRARELLGRARFLDDAATTDEKAAAELQARISALRTAAKAARDKADHAGADDKEVLVARAEDLETDLAVSEAEITFKRRAAADNRRVARELRQRAVRLVRDTPGSSGYATESMADAERTPTRMVSCDPPFRFTADGRKLYRLECLH